MAAGFVKMEMRIFLILLLCSGALGCPYTRAMTISVPKLEALSDTCLLIPCTFSAAIEHKDKLDLTKPVIAIWSKTYANVGRPTDPIFFHSAVGFASPMKMIGNLHQKNCTTLFSDIKTTHSDQYYLRIDNHNFKATALCDPLNITVQDAPWNPSVQVSGSQREQETVTITCSAPSPCPHSPPKLTWSLQPEPPHSMVQNSDGTFTTSQQHMVQNSDGTFTTSVQLQMRLSEQHHGLKVHCSAVYPVKEGQKSADKTISLSVEYSPKNTSVWLSANTSLSEGQSVNLSCSSRAWPPVQNFSWFRDTSQGPQRVHEGQVYSLIFNHATQGEYFCQAKNQVGEQNSPTIKLEGTLEYELPWKPILGGGIGLLILICIAVFIGLRISKSRAPKEAQIETCEDMRKEEDTVLYGEVVFSKSTTCRPGATVHHAENPEETIYSQVRVSKTAAGTTQPTEDLYATVKKS